MSEDASISGKRYRSMNREQINAEKRRLWKRTKAHSKLQADINRGYDAFLKARGERKAKRKWFEYGDLEAGEPLA